MSERGPLSGGPTGGDRLLDRGFRGLTWLIAWCTVGLVLLVMLEIGLSAAPAAREFGAGFFTSSVWDANQGRYGILPEIWGTLYSSMIALFLGTVFGVASAIFLTEDFLPLSVRNFIKAVVDLLAAIPSVIYGLWGIYVLIPLLREPANWLHENLGWIPFFGTPFRGPGMLPAALVLAIMILPTISAISRDALTAVPLKLREAALGLGATRWETLTRVVLPSASTGVFGAVTLAFGRALGETMAVAMLIGNANDLGVSLLSPSNTLASLLANRFPEASGIQVNALMFAALALLLITLLVNVCGSAIIWHARARLQGGRA